MARQQTPAFDLAAPAARPAAPAPGPGRRMVRRLLAIPPAETSFAVRGFRSDDAAIRERLEGVAGAFVRGYHAALAVDPPALAARLASEPPALQGFACEGAAFGATLLDVLTGWRRRRFARHLEAGDAQVYIIHIGAGWALARLPLAVDALLARLDPLLGWLALDGYGFHQGFFHAARAVGRREVPRKVQGYARRAFDQGLGRSLWFVEGADPGRIAADVAAFPAARHDDLWSGVGLAATYAGGRGPAALAALVRAAGEHAPALGQGAAFAAAARVRAGCVPAATDEACAVLCGRPASAAAALCGDAERDLPPDRPGEPAFEVWRRRIQREILPGGFHA